jgi:hypothetical protein
VYSTSVYYFIPRYQVVIYQGDSSRRYKLVYAKKIKLHRGVDNKIQFQFLNQDQKPVDITGKEITFRIIGQDGQKILLQKSLTPTLSLNGLCELLATSGEMDAVTDQMCSYSLEINEIGLDIPVFVNSEAGARGALEILDSVLPEHMPSVPVTIPSIPNTPGQEVTYNSSILNTGESSYLTLQTFFEDFTGDVQIQGSTTGVNDWYNIDSAHSYEENNESDMYNVVGFHPYLRYKITSSQGKITNILAR